MNFFLKYVIVSIESNINFHENQQSKRWDFFAEQTCSWHSDFE